MCEVGFASCMSYTDEPFEHGDFEDFEPFENAHRALDRL